MRVTPITNLNDLYTILINKVGVYFTSVTIDGNDNITCLDDERTPLYFRNANLSECVISGKDSTVYGNSFTDNVNANVLITEVIETQYGLVIYGKDNWAGSTVSMPVFIVTKDNAGNTVIFSHMFPTSEGGMDTYSCMNSVAPIPTKKKCLNSTDLSLLTSIVPVVVEGNMNYTPNLYWVIDKQYNLTGEIIIGTHHYWTDGQVALLDT